MNIIFKIVGWLFVGLGAAGIVLPVLPTTPFLLAASYLFYRSSPRARQWLLGNKTLGVFIRNYQIHKAIPMGTKIYSITLLWLTIGSTVCLFIDQWWLRIVLLLIAMAVTIHIVRFKTLRKENLLNE